VIIEEGGTMRNIIKYAAAAILTGALAFAAATPSQAEGGRNAAAVIGFGAGALVSAAAANANNGYYYGPSYGYDSYAYEPAPVYVEPSYGYEYAPTYSYRYRSGGKDDSIRLQR
jgi:hypothetical protein